MAIFNTMAVVPGGVSFGAIAPVWDNTYNPAVVVSPGAIAPVWGNTYNPAVVVVYGLFTEVIPSSYGRIQYTEGFYDGEIFGFSSQQEDNMEPIQLGETDDDKKTISFTLYSSAGYPASGLVGGAAVASPGVGDVQTNRDLAGYVNSTGVFSHVADGEYRYTFSNTEVASGGGEGNIFLRVKVTGFRTMVRRVPVRDIATATKARDAVLNAVRSGFVGTGTIGEGMSIAASLLQGNFLMDQVTNAANGQTAARIRCFHTGAAAAAATAGGSGQGEFATFLVATVYSGPGKITEHRVVQQ